MLHSFIIGSAIGILPAAGWYLWFRRANRRRSRRILGWIERAFSGRGSVGPVLWQNASCFQVELRLCPSIFRRASLAVRLEPRGRAPIGEKEICPTNVAETERPDFPTRNVNRLRVIIAIAQIMNRYAIAIDFGPGSRATSGCQFRSFEGCSDSHQASTSTKLEATTPVAAQRSRSSQGADNMPMR